MALTSIEREAIPRKTVMMFFIIDTSGSMQGSRIGSVNSAIEETLEILKEMNEESADAEIEIAMLEFSSGAEWLPPGRPVKVENFPWSGLEVDGLTHMGTAFQMLEEKLHKDSGFMQSASGSFAPVLFLMSDGEPTDDYKPHLEKLKNNKWFKASTKIALAIGDDANSEVLEEFTGNREAVVGVSSANAGTKLKKMITFIAVTSSQVASSTADAGSKQEQVTAKLQEAIEDDDFDIDDSSDDDDLGDW